MKLIGIIEPGRLVKIPERYRARHEFCFHLHDLMAQLLVRMEMSRAGHVSFQLTEADRAALAGSSHVLDFLASSGRGEVERRVVLNHMAIALYADMLHFIYEALRALEKRKFSVAFTLLRKPCKEGMLLTAQMCADETVFFAKLKSDAANLLNRNDLNEEGTRRLLEAAITACHGTGYLRADVIYDVVFDRKNEMGLARLFDKATHLVTENRHIRTEDYNINFIFKDPASNDVCAGNTYALISQILLFLSLMQITLYERMTEIGRPYRNWILFTALGSFEALFGSGKARVTNIVRREFSEFLECAMCGERLQLRKTNAPRLFISERIECASCNMDQGFPFGWLLGKIDLDLFGDRSKEE